MATRRPSRPSPVRADVATIPGVGCGGVERRSILLRTWMTGRPRRRGSRAAGVGWAVASWTVELEIVASCIVASWIVASCIVASWMRRIRSASARASRERAMPRASASSIRVWGSMGLGLEGGPEEAGLSTALRSGRDDRFCVGDVARRPAVSTRRMGIPESAKTSSMVSRVVPGVAVTMARSRSRRRLKSELLPALGSPIRASLMPSRCRLPKRKEAKSDSRGVRMAAMV